MFQIGYEIEFVSFLNPEAVRQKLLHRGFAIPELGSGRGQYLNWYLTTDRSIEDHSGRPYQGLEIISPVMPLVPALRNLRKLFNFLDEFGFETNSTTGFHVGISFKDRDRTVRVDQGALVTLMEEDKLLTLWNRKNNRYCRPQYENMTNALAKRYKNLAGLDPEDLRSFIRTDDKYQTVNFTKLGKKSPYFEFRIMGGPNYHRRYRDILKTVKIYLKALKKASEIGSGRSKIGYEEIRKLAKDVEVARDKMAELARRHRARMNDRLKGDHSPAKIETYLNNLPRFMTEEEYENA
jgi:hypothetical protein